MQQRIEFLLERYLSGAASEAELAELFKYVSSDESKPFLGTLLTDKWMQQAGTEATAFSFKSEEDVLAEILGNPLRYADIPVKKVSVYNRKWIAVAASLVIMSVTMVFLLKPSADADNGNMAHTTTPQPVDDVAPGGNRATLTLADGSTVILEDDAEETAIDVNVVQKNGELIYNSALTPGGRSAAVDGTAYNTMVTPIGGQYKIKLPDGTRVWLNAASSIKYPVSFDDKERIVTVTGEAYFEVARDSRRKFVVNVNGSITEVLGTTFNVNGYADEKDVIITLANGSVKVSSANTDAKILKPGERAGWNNKTRKITVEKADVETALAWKNGLFQFNGANIETIMRMIGKWYGVEVRYLGKIPEGHYSGVVSRSSDLSRVLKILEESGLQFLLEGKRLTVL